MLVEPSLSTHYLDIVLDQQKFNNDCPSLTFFDSASDLLKDTCLMMGLMFFLKLLFKKLDEKNLTEATLVKSWRRPLRCDFG